MSKTIRRGQVWFYEPTVSYSGHIQRGPRPVIIVSNDTLNETSPVVLAIPCTTQLKRNFPTHAMFVMNNRVNVALAEQTMPINVNELKDLRYTLEDFVMEQVDAALNVAFGFKEVSVYSSDDTSTTPEPVEKSVDNVDKKQPVSQVSKFYRRYPQLAPQKPARRRWTKQEAEQLVKDFKSIAGRDVLEKKYGLSYETLQRYYYRFKNRG